MGGAVAPETEQAPGVQPGGAPAAPQGGAEGGEQDPIVQLVQMATQALQSQDPQMAMAVCDGLVQLVQGGGQRAPAQEEPVMMRKGGKMMKKCAKGGKCETKPAKIKK